MWVLRVSAKYIKCSPSSFLSINIYCNTIHPYKVTSLRSFSEANTDRYENGESIEVVFASYYISKKQVWLTKKESF